MKSLLQKDHFIDFFFIAYVVCSTSIYPSWTLEEEKTDSRNLMPWGQLVNVSIMEGDRELDVQERKISVF